LRVLLLSGRDLCDELITRPEEPYRLSCVVVCDLETSWMRRPWPTGGCRAKNKQNETLFPNWQKESWKTFEETSECVRPERVNMWPNSMTYIWWW
jgi:hypothetical protein